MAKESAKSKKRKEGIVIRLSREVINYIEKRQHEGESFDASLRRIFGLRGRKGEANSLRTYFVCPNGGSAKVFSELSEARGEAILFATRKGLKKAEAVLTVMEVA